MIQHFINVLVGILVAATVFAAANSCSGQPVSVFEKLVGSWRDLRSHATITITRYGNVSTSSSKGLFGRVNNSIASGGNFIFENDRTRCVYDIAFLRGGATDWGLISETLEGSCPKGGIFEPTIEESIASPSTNSSTQGVTVRKLFTSPSFVFTGQEWSSVPSSMGGASYEDKGDKVYYAECLDDLAKMCGREAADHLCKIFGYTGAVSWKYAGGSDKLLFYPADKAVNRGWYHKPPHRYFLELGCN